MLSHQRERNLPHAVAPVSFSKAVTSSAALSLQMGCAGRSGTRERFRRERLLSWICATMEPPIQPVFGETSDFPVSAGLMESRAASQTLPDLGSSDDRSGGIAQRKRLNLIRRWWIDEFAIDVIFELLGVSPIHLHRALPSLGQHGAPRSKVEAGDIAGLAIGSRLYPEKVRRSVIGLYQPKTATADLTMIPPSGLLRS